MPPSKAQPFYIGNTVFPPNVHFQSVNLLFSLDRKNKCKNSKNRKHGSAPLLL
nr:MAG TPA: hypothetical protein [Caudoviricetes sp.]